MLFTFIGLKQQEVEAEKRMAKERYRTKIGKLIGKMGIYVNKIGKEAILQEELELMPQIDDGKRELKRINIGGLGLLDEIAENEVSEEEDLNQSNPPFHPLFKKLTPYFSYRKTERNNQSLIQQPNQATNDRI